MRSFAKEGLCVRAVSYAGQSAPVHAYWWDACCQLARGPGRRPACLVTQLLTIAKARGRRHSVSKSHDDFIVWLFSMTGETYRTCAPQAHLHWGLGPDGLLAIAVLALMSGIGPRRSVP